LAGATVTVRRASATPPPHAVEHADGGDQSDTTQSTGVRAKAGGSARGAGHASPARMRARMSTTPPMAQIPRPAKSQRSHQNYNDKKYLDKLKKSN
jgi:hypothetical protein